MSLPDLSTQADPCYLVLRQARESLVELAGLPVQQSARRKARALARLLEKLQAKSSAPPEGCKLPQTLSEQALKEKDIHPNKAHRVAASVATAGTGYVLKRDAGRVDVLEALTKLLEGVWDPELHKFPSGGGGRLWIAGVLGHFLEREVTLCQLEEWFPRPGNQNRITSLSFLKLLANKGIKQWPPGKKRLPECTSFVRSSRKRHHPEASFDPKPRSSIPPSPSGAADDAESSILDPRDLSTLFSEDYANNSLQASAFMRVEDDWDATFA